MSGQDVRDRPVPLRSGPPARGAARTELTIDPRILARLLSVRHDRRRRRWRMAVAFLALATLAALAWALARSPLLAVRQLEVVGAVHTGKPAVLAASGVVRGRPVLDVGAATIGRRLLALPWVVRVQVTRQWPHTVTIRVTERSPVALVGGPGGQVAVVDQTGRVLVTGPNLAALGLPGADSLPRVLDSPPAGPPGSVLGPGVGRALIVLPTLTAALSGPVSPAGSGAAPEVRRIAAVSLGTDGSLRVVLSPGPVTVLVGNTAGLDAKVVAVRSLLAQVPPGMAATIDVRVVDAPVLTAGKIGTMVSTTQRG